MKKNAMLIGAIALSVGALVMSVMNSTSASKIGYFDYNEAYNECEMKKNLEKDLEKLVSARKSELDSMQMELSYLSTSIKGGSAAETDMEKFESMKHRFLTLQGKYEEENMRLKEEYYKQIRTHINKKAKEFGESQGFDYLFAAMGDGALMHANESMDVTKDLMVQLNK